MSGNVLRYFAGGNTAKGFSHLYDSNLRGLDRVFILSGKSDSEKKSLIHKVMNEWSGSSLNIEALHCPNDPDSLEGLIIRNLSFGIIDGDSPRDVGKEFVGDRWETIDLDVIDFSSIAAGTRKEITRLAAKRDQAFEQAYQSYATGLRVHDKWEQIYIGQMDFNKADHVAEDLLKQLFLKYTSRKNRTTRRRFLGAATPNGPVDFVGNITSGLTRRFFLKGRAGTGKSTVLRKIAMEAERRGYDVEIYHCGFDPASLDMVIVRELGWAVFDSTQPHEYFPSQQGDEVVDMYELTVAPGTDELFANEIAEIERQYREQMKAGKMFLAEAKQINDELESLYQKKMDHARIDEIYSDIQKEMKLLAKD